MIHLMEEKDKIAISNVVKDLAQRLQEGDPEAVKATSRILFKAGIIDKEGNPLSPYKEKVDEYSKRRSLKG